MNSRIYSSIRKHFAFFVCYSIVGWLYEELLWIFEEHQIVNRGFCLGPWLPIYGFGGLILYRTVYKFAISHSPYRMRALKPAVVFLMVSAGAVFVELVSTYIMQAAGIDFRTLWSYADYAINFEERVALLPALKFGILGCVIIYFAQDKIRRFAYSKKKYIVATRRIMCLCFVLDVALHIATGSNYTGNVLFVL